MEYVNITPKWAGLLPAMLLVLEQGETEEAKHNIREELMKMAKALDSHNDSIREEAAKAGQRKENPDKEVADYNLADTKVCTVNGCLMMLPPDCGNYYGYVDRDGVYTWYNMPAFIDNTPDVLNFGIVEPIDPEDDGFNIIKDWVIMMRNLIEDIYNKGL